MMLEKRDFYALNRLGRRAGTVEINNSYNSGDSDSVFEHTVPDTVGHTALHSRLRKYVRITSNVPINIKFGP